jgi:acyl dehydratase
MPYDSIMVGGASKAFANEIDARWLMSYAAGLGDPAPAYFDTEANDVIGHPMFPVCLEWQPILDCINIPGAESVTPAEHRRDVHAAHDLHIYRPICAGDKLTTTATVIGLEQIRPGAAQTIRLDTIAEDGELVCRTYQLGIKRDVSIIGQPNFIESAPELPKLTTPVGAEQRFAIPVSKEAAHLYTECARIWNPVHTDRAVALAAGLPDIILHGTATMALAVSTIVGQLLDGDSTRITRLGGRFRAMVLMPSTITLTIQANENGVVAYTVFTADDKPAISQGFVCYRD